MAIRRSGYNVRSGKTHYRGPNRPKTITKIPYSKLPNRFNKFNREMNEKTSALELIETGLDISGDILDLTGHVEIAKVVRGLDKLLELYINRKDIKTDIDSLKILTNQYMKADAEDRRIIYKRMRLKYMNIKSKFD